MKKVPPLFFILVVLSACVSVHKTTEVADYPTDSFVKVTLHLDEEEVSSGSGSVVKQTAHGTTILTAAHVCSSSRLETVGAIEDKESSVLVNGYEISTKRFQRDIDVCLVLVPEGLRDKPDLSIASTQPVSDEKYYTVSSPVGMADPDTGLVGRFKGLYLGDTMLGGEPKSVYSIPSAGGASGSPILNENEEIVGITTHGWRGFTGATISPIYFDLVKFLING